jgi:hypothetical protein
MVLPEWVQVGLFGGILLECLKTRVDQDSHEFKGLLMLESVDTETETS